MANEANAYTRFGGTNLDYDRNGNMTDDGSNRYEYDAFNRITSVYDKEGGKVKARYSYDAHNRRMRKTLNPTVPSPSMGEGRGEGDHGVTYYTYSAWQVVAEYEGPSETKQFIYGQGIDSPVTMITFKEGKAQKFFYQTDHLGSITAITDEEGKVVKKYRYDAYGKILDLAKNSDKNGGVSNPYLYTGRRYDAETGLYYYRNRYYSAEVGRFMTRDPLGYKNEFYASKALVANGSRYKSADYLGMSTRRQFIPQNFVSSVTSTNKLIELGLYAYVENNPLNRTDPSGLFGPHIHYASTFFAMKAAGFSYGDSHKTASSNVHTDFLPESQQMDEYHTVMHSMSGRKADGIYQSAVEAKVSSDNYISSLLIQSAKLEVNGKRGKSLEVLGRALHAAQDVVSHEYEEWQGASFNWDTIHHIIRDNLPSAVFMESLLQQNAAITETTIGKYVQLVRDKKG